MQATLTSTDNARSQPIFRVITLLLIIGSYGYFMASMWPGVLAEDSRAALLYIDGLTPFFPGKTAFWMQFLDLTYNRTKLVEVPVLVMASICVLVLCRIQLYLLDLRRYKSFVFCLVFITLAPHLIVLNLTLMGDGIFAVATIGLFFELYLCCQRRRLTATSTAIIVATAGFALLTRTNGLTALLPLFLTLFYLPQKGKLVLGLIIGAYLAGMVALNKAQGDLKPQGAVFPLVIWETVNFLRPPAMKTPTSFDRVSPKTIATLEELAPLDLYLRFYDREYWDPLNFAAGGPGVSRFTPAQQKVLTKEFFKRNLPKNLAAFMGSRVHVFFATALAYSGLPWPGYTPVVLPQTSSLSEAWPLAHYSFFKLPEKIFIESFKKRAILWTPFIAIAILGFALVKFSKKIISIEFFISLTFLFQLAGIFFFSIASEYRYISILVYAPLILLPMLTNQRDKNLANS